MFGNTTCRHTFCLFVSFLRAELSFYLQLSSRPRRRGTKGTFRPLQAAVVPRAREARDRAAGALPAPVCALRARERTWGLPLCGTPGARSFPGPASLVEPHLSPAVRRGLSPRALGSGSLWPGPGTRSAVPAVGAGLRRHEAPRSDGFWKLPLPRAKKLLSGRARSPPVPLRFPSRGPLFSAHR